MEKLDKEKATHKHLFLLIKTPFNHTSFIVYCMHIKSS